MRFFLCNDKSKFTKSQNIKQYGDWYFIHEDDVKVYEDNNHLVLYCGYLIEGDIIEACKNFSFDDAEIKKATPSEFKRLFGKSMQSRLVSRVVLNKFIKEVA